MQSNRGLPLAKGNPRGSSREGGVPLKLSGFQNLTGFPVNVTLSANVVRLSLAVKASLSPNCYNAFTLGMSHSHTEYEAAAHT